MAFPKSEKLSGVIKNYKKEKRKWQRKHWEW